jgi:enoyl-CoA hydratase/carnithine racemase
MRVISRRRLQEMCFFAERFDAQEACRLEIVNQVVTAQNLDAAVSSLVAKLVANSPVALRMGRRAFAAMSDLSLNDALNLAQTILPIMSQSEDTKEGMLAFAQRRTPVWPNR